MVLEGRRSEHRRETMHATRFLVDGLDNYIFIFTLRFTFYIHSKHKGGKKILVVSYLLHAHYFLEKSIK